MTGFDAPTPLSLGERRQARPPPLRLPSGPGGLNVKNDNSLKTPMRTPMSGTSSPMLFKVDPSVMTPDTAEFPRGGPWPSANPWTDDENGIIEAYLAKPPRSSTQTYAPGELPPPNIIGEIALQILKAEGSKLSGWSRSFEETRRQVFKIAREESMEKVGGHHRRTPSDMSDIHDVVLEDRIDEVENDLVIPNFSIALDLSDKDKARSIAAPLSSPMEMNFDSASKGPKRVPISSGNHGSGPRPPSLLQRGGSFTSSDLLNDNNFFTRADSHEDSEDRATVTVMHSGQGGTSPVSIITNSPPSSVDSHSLYEEAEMEVEVEPYTPVEQTFPSDIHSSAATPTGRRASPRSPRTRTVTATPSNPAPAEIPWTAPSLGRSESGSRRDSDGEEDIAEQDRFKRQKTRIGTRASNERGRSADGRKSD